MEGIQKQQQETLLESSMSSEFHFSRELDFWMTNMPKQLKRIPIIHLAIPGSHDSATWTINKHSDWAPDMDSILKNLKWLGVIVKYITSRWSKAQQYSIYGQLSVGVRYFDLRIATKVNKDNVRDFYIVHGLYGPPVKEVLSEFVTFLEAHSNEVVIFDCQHFFDFTSMDHDNLARMIRNHFHGKIVPSISCYMEHLTLDYMNENTFQVMVIYRHDSCSKFDFFSSKAYPTPWPNTTSPDHLVDILSNNIVNRNEKVGYVSQFILTPVAKTIILNLFTGNLKKFSGLKLCTQKLSWVKDQSPGAKGVNVVIADFVDILNFEFCRTVINLNIKLISESNDGTRRLLPPVTN